MAKNKKATKKNIESPEINFVGDAREKISELESIVIAKDIFKIYNPGEEYEVRALDGVNLEIRKGEMLSIMGPSGSGKTTLLNCLSGIDEASSGEIIVDGSDIQKMGDKKKTKYRAANMGFIFQTFNLIPVLSAVENVEMPLLVNGISAKSARAKAVDILVKVGLGDRLHHKPNELSGGQRQRVTIARAIVHNPAVIWADEPTGNLDSRTAEEIFALIKELNKELNETMVIVTHDERIANQTDRIIRIDSGKIISNT